jgi:hypothetical protein
MWKGVDMRSTFVLLLVAAMVSVVSAGEVLFTSGPQEYEGVKYYWLAEWKLEITVGDDVGADDRLEVLFGSKGANKRTLYYDYEGKSGSLRHAGEKGYAWIEVPAGGLVGGKKVLLYGKGRESVAFLAGVRIGGESTLPPKVKPVRTAGSASSGGHRAQWADVGGFEMNADAARLWAPSSAKPDWDRAERSGRYAGIALGKVQRWLRDECLAVRDEESGLFRPTGRIWNYRDTAADCYPFYVWAAYYTDKELLDTVMIDVLEAEQRLCNHLDRLPVRYDMDTGEKIVTDFDTMIFGASEYAKDGLIPIVEITGREYPWYGRMRGIVDDIFKHARVETPYGKIPSTNIEVNGELLQLLPRLFSMTGERKYLDWAHRLADYYLLKGGFVPSRLSDHGCEIIGGLGLLFVVDKTACPEKLAEYKPHMEYMFDEILKRGLNSDGFIIGALQATEGPHDKVTMRDGWGYDFVGYLDYDIAVGSDRYGGAMRRAMGNLLKPRYVKFNWDSGSRDNIADSVEGGLYLAYRMPVTETFLWADREIATVLVDHTDADRLWGVHKLEANTVRTVLIHTMLHTRNTIARPWRQGLELGAAPCADGICVFMKSDELYEGRLQFDIPRHRLYMGFEQDWPRMNAVPEWFTVEPDESHKYEVKFAGSGERKVVSGKLLSEGLPIRVEAGKALRLIVTGL